LEGEGTVLTCLGVNVFGRGVVKKTHGRDFESFKMNVPSPRFFRTHAFLKYYNSGKITSRRGIGGSNLFEKIIDALYLHFEVFKNRPLLLQFYIGY
jgi:hypothetical protein